MLSNFMLNSNSELLGLVKKKGIEKYYGPGDVIISKGDIKYQTAFILEGLVKITLGKENNSLLLYHLNAENNSIISFMNIYNNTPIQIAVTTIKQSRLLWVSNTDVLNMALLYPDLKKMIVDSYYYNHEQLVLITKNIISKSLDNRIFDYLMTKSSLYNSQKITISRLEMASDLHVSKEAISRSLKKLETQGKIKRSKNLIHLTQF